jgi:hypothetical protein
MHAAQKQQLYLIGISCTTKSGETKPGFGTGIRPSGIIMFIPFDFQKNELVVFKCMDRYEFMMVHSLCHDTPNVAPSGQKLPQSQPVRNPPMAM